jgi:serine/threonine protein kinase
MTDRLFVISEHYSTSLAQVVEEARRVSSTRGGGGGGGLPEDVIRRYLFQTLSALSHLNQEGITHRNLHLSNILLDNQVRALL